MTPSQNFRPSTSELPPVIDDSPAPPGPEAVELRLRGGNNVEDAQLVHSIAVAKRFGRKASHDFNNILAVVQGFATILQNRLQNDEANRGIAAQIEASAVEALKLTNWLSTFANNRPGEMVLLDLNKVLEECAASPDNVKPPAVELQMKLAPDPLLIMGDEIQLERVYQELWSNAVDAMPEGGRVCFQTCLDELPQQCSPGPGSDGFASFCRLRISDTGTGIDAETQKFMFEPFYSTKNGKGRGLGLSTVYDVVRGHQGFVQVSSEPGLGTCVDLYFPAQVGTDVQGKPDQKSTKLLVVDDEDLIRMMIEHMLKELGCEVISAASGEEALDAYRGANGEIKAAILDMTLPGMTGSETFRKMKEIDQQLKVIISTGDPHQQAVHDVMAQGAFGVLAKPFSAEHLIKVVQQALG